MDEYAVVIDVVVEIVEEAPPPLHDQTSLEIAANSEHGIPAEETLAASQELYEAGLISYPRTSSHYITPEMEQSVSALLSGSEGTTFSDAGGTASPGTGGATSSGSGGTDSPRLNGKEVYGPYYDEAVKYYEDNPDYFPDPDVCTITQGEELDEMRHQYDSMVARGQLDRGHHRQGLAFGGKNERSNIQHTGESTIRRSELPKELQKEYYEKGYTSNPNYKQAKIVEDPNGNISKNGKTYSLGLNSNHTEATNFQNKVIRWQEQVGLREKRKGK